MSGGDFTRFLHPHADLLHLASRVATHLQRNYPQLNVAHVRFSSHSFELETIGRAYTGDADA